MLFRRTTSQTAAQARRAGWIPARFPVWGLLAVAVTGLALLALLAVCFGVGLTHGHGNESLELTVRVVDRETGQPIAGALVTTVLHRSILESETLEPRLREAIEDMKTTGASSFHPFVCGARTSDRATTVVRSFVHVTRYRFLSIQTEEEVFVPELLLVDHPRYGRKVVPIPRDPQAEEGDEEGTWRLDLGTVSLSG